MSVYNPNDPRDYLRIVKEVQKAKECGYKIELKKFHPIQMGGTSICINIAG